MTHVLIVGAGPAGLAAARAADSLGARVTVVDAADATGGQYWRHLPASRPAARERLLHHGWDQFAALDRAVRGTELLLGAQVWSIETGPDGVAVHLAVGEPDADGRELRTVRADRLVLATGAYDRALPVPGGTLGGVYTAGAAQAFAKGERIALGQRVVVSGAGPFLLPVARSLGQAGARVVGVYEANPTGRLLRQWLRRPSELLGAAHKAGELASYLTHFLGRRVGYHPGQQVVAIHGDGRVEAVTVARLDADWRPVPGSQRQLSCDAVCLGHGFTPRLEAALAAGCALGDDRFVRVDEAQQTSVPGVYAAGELTAIGGADHALATGEIAGWAAAGGELHDPRLAGARRRRGQAVAFARRIEAAHGIRAGWLEWLTDATVVCRCEEVTSGALRATATATAADGLRSAKLTTRAGLGLCQGRVCGRNAEAVWLAARGIDGFADSASSDRRPIIAPVTLGDLAALAGPGNPQQEGPS